ncbi:MAG: L,D-transpeptidase family protein [Hyphomicrobiaceae bacterium]
MMLYRFLAALLIGMAAASTVSAEDQAAVPAAGTSQPTRAAGLEPNHATKTGSAPSGAAAGVASKPEEGSETVADRAPTSVSKESGSVVASQGGTPPAAPTSKNESDKTEPAAAVAETSPASPRSDTASGGLDAVPAGADPLTPPTTDTGPTRAPGAPQRPAVARTVTEVDPFIVSLRARLESWPESRAKADQEDLTALKGYYGESDAVRLWTKADGLSPRAEAALKALERADEWGLEAAAFETPKHPDAGSPPETLVDVEIRMGLEVLKYARYARGGRTDPSSVSRLIDVRLNLYEPRSVIEAIAEAPSADVYLESLQPHHAGFVALKAALARLRENRNSTSVGGEPKQTPKREISSEERRVVVNMERWRWLPQDLGEFYILDNIPEQITRVVHDGKVVHHAKIVVGKPSTPTPVFSMPMRFVIFHPTWGVPDGIKSNELGPMLRRAQARAANDWFFFSENDGASRALRRHELRVYSNGREIDPNSVNWSSTDIRRYSFIQGASRSNVLGVVKFRFPNKHDVYMHDTSERHLFSRKSRAFSHGCMRVEDPLKLAELILAYDQGWSRSRIDQIVARGATHDVTLQKKVNVHIAYFTATADQDGKLHTFGDIYGIDSRTASALAGRSVVLSSAHTDEDVAPSRQQRPARAASRTPARGRQASTAQQAPAVPPRAWNAFRGNFGN